MQRFAIALCLIVSLVFIVASQPQETTALPLAPAITASDYQVIPRQTVSVNLTEHPPESNPYALVWVDSGYSLVEVISSTLVVDPGGSKLNIPFTIPADSLGTYYLESRQVGVSFVRSDAVAVVTPVYLVLPLMLHNQPPLYTCPTTSTNQYVGGIAFQAESDNPVRPAYNHADKNIALRSYTANTDLDLKRELVGYGAGDPTQPPQLATLFAPYRVPGLREFYRVHSWNWAPSPDPGSRGAPVTFPPVTALGLWTTPGETLHAPTSGYDIGNGMEVIVLFADEDTITLKYTREDTAAAGYTLHIDNICTDPNLLARYNLLDAPDGPRYSFDPGHSYELPVLAAGQPFGTARSWELVVAVVDTGAFQDTRSCEEWWQIRPGYTGTCPPGP